MAKQTIAYLQTKFETSDVPTQQDFYDFLDSYEHKDDRNYIEVLESSIAFDPQSPNSGFTSPTIEDGKGFLFVFFTNGLATYKVATSSWQLITFMDKSQTNVVSDLATLRGIDGDTLAPTFSMPDSTHTYEGVDYLFIGGMFEKTDENITENGGTFFVLNDGTKVKRKTDGVNVFPEWWTMGGIDENGNSPDNNINNGIVCESDRIVAALSVLDKGGVLNLRGGQTYTMKKPIVFPDYGDGTNVVVNGNFATLKRSDVHHSVLTSAASSGDTTINVADASVFSVGESILVSTGLTISDTSTGNSQNHLITNISGNTITFSVAIANNMPIGADVFNVVTMVAAQPLDDVRIDFQNLILDGNSDSHQYTADWTKNAAINISGGDRAKLNFEGCEFYNHKTEAIIFGTQMSFRKGIFKNIGGGCFHGSIVIGGTNATLQQNTIDDVVYDNIGYHTLENGHNVQVGFYTQSVGTSSVTMNNVRGYNNSGGILGGILSSGSDLFTVSNCKFYGADHIILAGGSSGSLIEALAITNNVFVNCGGIKMGNAVSSNVPAITKSIISNNTFKNCWVQMYQMQECVVSNNIFMTETDSSFTDFATSYILQSEQNATLSVGGSYNRITDNSFINNTSDQDIQVAIFITNAAFTNNCEISNNKIFGYEIGITQTFAGGSAIREGMVYQNNHITLSTNTNAASHGLRALSGALVKNNHVINPNNTIGIHVYSNSAATGGVKGSDIIGNTVEGSSFSGAMTCTYAGHYCRYNSVEGGYSFPSGLANSMLVGNIIRNGLTITNYPI